MSVVLGVDASLTSTGLAHVDTTSLEWVTTRIRTDTGGKAAVGDPIKRQARRLRRIAVAVRQFPSTIEPPFGDLDLIVLEGMSFGSIGRGSRDSAGLWWRIVDELALAFPCPLLIVEPKTRAKYAAGSGNADKSDVLAAVRATYPDVDVPQHDVADAMTLAAIGARFLGCPVELDARPWMVDVAGQIAAREQKKGAL